MRQASTFFLAAITVALILNGCGTPGKVRTADDPVLEVDVPATKDTTQLKARFFRHVGENHIIDALSPDKREGAFVEVVEVGPDHRPLTGDTLRVWVQHDTAESGNLQPEARHADLIISCFPRSIVSERLRRKHVFPNARGDVWGFNVKSGYAIVTNRYSPTLRFAILSLMQFRMTTQR